MFLDLPDPDPDPYLSLVDPNPDPGGPKIFGSNRSGSGFGALVRGIDPGIRIRICTKISWIRNTALFHSSTAPNFDVKKFNIPYPL
jgi:hypothetical protein